MHGLGEGDTGEKKKRGRVQLSVMSHAPERPAGAEKKNVSTRSGKKH